MNKSTNFKVGDPVFFDTPEGEKAGLIVDLLPCITNGRKHASVELLGTLRGCFHMVPLDELDWIL